MDFTVIKYSGQGSFKVKKATIDNFLFFTGNHRHLPIESVNDPLSYMIHHLYYQKSHENINSPAPKAHHL